MSTKHLDMALVKDWSGRGDQKFFKREKIKEGVCLKKED